MPGETLCILGRSGVGKSVSLQHIMGFLKPDSGQNPGGRRRHHALHRRADAGGSAQGHDGLPEWRAVRLSDGWGKCRVSAAGRSGPLGRSDSADCARTAGDGGRGGDGGSAAVGSFDRDEALGGDCAGAGRGAGGDSLRRADDHGRSADRAAAGQSDPEAAGINCT